MSYDAHFRVWRGDDDGGELVDYTVEVNEGEVILDIIHPRADYQIGARSGCHGRRSDNPLASSSCASETVR